MLVFPVTGVKLDAVIASLSSQNNVQLVCIRTDAEGENALSGYVQSLTIFPPFLDADVDRQWWSAVVDVYDTYEKSPDPVDPEAKPIGEECLIIFWEQTDRGLVFFNERSDDEALPFTASNLLEKSPILIGHFAGTEDYVPAAVTIDVRAH